MRNASIIDDGRCDDGGAVGGRFRDCRVRKFTSNSDLAANTLLQWRFGLAALALGVAGHFTHPMPGRTRAKLLAGRISLDGPGQLLLRGSGTHHGGHNGAPAVPRLALVVAYRVLLGRRPAPRQLLAAMVALAGPAVIVGAPSAADGSAVGLMFGAGAGATFACYLLIGVIAFDGVPPFVTATHNMAVAAIGFVALDLVTHRGLPLPAGGAQWLVVAGMAIAPTLVAIPLLFAAIRRIGAAPTSVITTAEPVFTLAFGAALSSEPVGRVQLAGGGLIVAAAVIAQRGARRIAITRIATGALLAEGRTEPEGRVFPVGLPARSHRFDSRLARLQLLPYA